MKVLVISLLRLGDILLATSVIRSLKKQNPKARVHLLINTQFQTLASMIPNVEKVYTFDRQGLQDIIGSQDSNLLEAFYRVDDLVDQLQTEKYDQVLNLTHNRLSGWLTTLIGCPQTKGVTYGTNGRLSTGSTWFEYLNSTTEPSHKNTFHFIDVFHYGIGLESLDRKIDLSETVKGREYARELFSHHQDKTKVLIQPCTSEEKKSLPPEK